MIIFFDTETTGLKPGRIIQLSYIIMDRNKTIGKNFFCFTRDIEPSAEKIHGISVQMLASLSNNRTFSEHIDEIDNDFRSANLVVAHNFAFDFSFLSAEFGHESRIFHYNEKFDTMKEFKNLTALPAPHSKNRAYKYPKLTELAEYFEICDYDVTRKAVELFGNGTQSHDARFDVTQTYLCLKAAASRDDTLKKRLVEFL